MKLSLSTSLAIATCFSSLHTSAGLATSRRRDAEPCRASQCHELEAPNLVARAIIPVPVSIPRPAIPPAAPAIPRPINAPDPVLGSEPIGAPANPPRPPSDAPEPAQPNRPDESPGGDAPDTSGPDSPDSGSDSTPNSDSDPDVEVPDIDLPDDSGSAASTTQPPLFPRPTGTGAAATPVLGAMSTPATTTQIIGGTQTTGLANPTISGGTITSKASSRAVVDAPCVFAMAFMILLLMV